MPAPPKKSTNKKVNKKVEPKVEAPKEPKAPKKEPKEPKKEPKEPKAPKEPKEPSKEHDSFSTRLTKQISDNTINGELNEIINELKTKLEYKPVLDEEGNQVLDKKGKPKTKEPKEIGKYRSNKVRFSRGCGKYLSTILTKAIGDLLNLASVNAHLNKKKTIHVDNLLSDHTMLKSKYLGLFVLLPEFNLHKQEVQTEDEKTELKYVLEDKGNKFVHYVEKKFKKELVEQKNAKGELVKTMLGKDIKQYLNNLIISFCEDFAKKLELYLQGNGLKTVSEEVIKTIVSMLISNTFVNRKNNINKEGEDDTLKVTSNVEYSDESGKNLSEML